MEGYFKDYTVILASYVNDRDGIGVEIYKDNKILIEVFRGDRNKKHLISCYENDLPLDFVEESIKLFKKEIPQFFID